MSDRLSGAAATDESRAAARVGGGETLYEIRDLMKHFPLTSGMIFRKQVGAVHAVDGVSFDVKRGETLGLVGRVRLRQVDHRPPAAAAARPDQRLDQVRGPGDRGHQAARSSIEFRRDAQMIFQDPYSSLNPRKTVGSIIGEPFVDPRDEDRRGRAPQRGAGADGHASGSTPSTTTATRTSSRAASASASASRARSR